MCQIPSRWIRDEAPRSRSAAALGEAALTPPDPSLSDQLRQFTPPLKRYRGIHTARVDQLHAHMVRTSGQVRVNSRADAIDVADGKETGYQTVVDILDFFLSEAQVKPTMPVIRQTAVMGKRLQREFTCLGLIRFQDDALLGREQLVGPENLAGLEAVIRGDKIGMGPGRELAAKFEHAGTQCGDTKVLFWQTCNRGAANPIAHDGERFLPRFADQRAVTDTQAEHQPALLRRGKPQEPFCQVLGLVLPNVDDPGSDDNATGRPEQPVKVASDIAADSAGDPERAIAEIFKFVGGREGRLAGSKAQFHRPDADPAKFRRGGHIEISCQRCSTSELLIKTLPSTWMN